MSHMMSGSAIRPDVVLLPPTQQHAQDATTSNMSFQDIEAGRAHTSRSPSSTPQSREDNAFQNLQSSLSLQVFKMNANVQGILKLVDQLGTGKDSATLRKTLCVTNRLCALYPQPQI